MYPSILTCSKVLTFQYVVQESVYAWYKGIKPYLQQGSHCDSQQQKSPGLLLSTSSWSWIFSFLTSLTMLDSSLIAPNQNAAWRMKSEKLFCSIMCHLVFHHCGITFWHLEIVNLKREMSLSDLTYKECFVINDLSGITLTTMHYDTPGQAKQEMRSKALVNIPLL